MPKVKPTTDPREQTREAVFGVCRTAALVANDVVQSTTPPDQWHALCKVSFFDGAGRLHRCSCTCHVGHNSCTRCKGKGVELDPRTLQCADADACEQRYQAMLDAHPRTRRYREWGDAIDAAHAEAKAEESKRPAGKPKVGACHHCGAETKGGMFLPGHDAKLKGILMRRGQDVGGGWAVAELHARGWFPKPGNRTIADYDTGSLAKGEEIAQSYPAHRIIQARFSERMALIAKGRSPEDAVFYQTEPNMEEGE